jgi:hypothetical protein
MSNLKNIVTDLFSRRTSGSQALELALPLMRGKVTDAELAWLVNEHDGYAMAEGDVEFEGGLPRHVTPYRLIYVEGLVLRDPNGVENPVEHWPSTENRLQVIPWNLTEVESKISTANEEGYIFPPCLFNMPSAPAGFELRQAVHKSQLLRICERFRQEFIQLAGRV